MERERTVLFVNQDPDSLRVYGELLRTLGYKVEVADSAEAGLKRAISHRPDVIVTEVNERTTLGWKTPDLLKGDPHTREIPLIVLTAWVLPEDRARAHTSGCDVFLEKPTLPRDFVALLADLLSV